MSLAEAVVSSALVIAVQCGWRPQQRPQLLQVLFNSACLAIAAAGAWLASRAMEPWLADSLAGKLIVATLVLYGINTLLVAAVLCLAERKPMGEIWQSCYSWSFPYYLVGAAAAGLMKGVCRTAGWPPALLILPVMALVYVSYRVHVQQAGA